MQKNTSESKNRNARRMRLVNAWIPAAVDNEEAAVGQQIRRKPGWYFVTAQTLQKLHIVVL